MTIDDNIRPKWDGLLGSVTTLWAELKSNRRAAGGLLAIGLLIGGYGLLGLNDAVVAMRSSCGQEMIRLRRLESAGEEKDWPARAKASAALRETLDARLWKAESDGIALANLQDWVTTAGRESGLDRLQVKIEMAKPAGLPPDFRQLTATISSGDTEPTLEAFLARIQRDPHLLVIDHLHAQDRPTASFEMSLVTYAKLVGAGGKAVND